MTSSGSLADFSVAFLVAAVAAAALTPIMRATARHFAVVSRPKDDRWHRRAIPLLGGVAVFLATIGPAAWFVEWSRPTLALLGATTAMFGLGLVDDLLRLKPSTKLNAQITVMCCVVVTGPLLEWTGSPAINALVSIFWFVGITNAFNLLDNMDGLCAGIGTIAAIAFCLSVGSSQPSLFLFGALLAGAATGFLVFNFQPASIFMGDSGSLFIGSSLALLAVVSEPIARTGVLSALAVPALLMLIPIFDTTFVTLSRKLSARSASVGGRDHTSHRLVALGFSERQAVLLLYALAAFGGATAVAISQSVVRETGVVVALLVVTLVLLGVRLARVKVYGDDDFAALRGKPFTPILVEFTYRRRVFEVLLDLGLVSLAYYTSYVLRFDREFPVYYDLFVRSLPVVIACHLAGFFVAGVYRGVWRYLSLADLITYGKGLALAALSTVLALVYLYRFEGYSRGVFIINTMLVGILVVGSRVAFRIIGDVASRYRVRGQRAFIYGAGDAGALVLRELRNNPRYDLQAIGFIDDDPLKLRQRILGLPVLGGVDALGELVAVHRPDVIIVSPSQMEPANLARLRKVSFESGTAVWQLDFRLEPVLLLQP